MLKNNKVNIIIALVMAIILWVYVLGDVNPDTTTTMKNVPIQFLNQDAMEASGFVLIDSDYYRTNVKYNGKRSDVNKVDESDFSVTADLEGLRKGEYKLKLVVTGPENIKIDSLSVEKITVNIDQWAEETRKVDAQIVNQISDETEPAIYQVSRSELKISGGQSLLDKVKYLRADLEADKIGPDLKAYTVKAIPVDENGAEVMGVTVEESNVSVTAVLLAKKTVPLTTVFEGRNEGGIERKIECPKTITIKGMMKDIEGIEGVTSEPINLAEVYESSRFDIKPLLPEGVVVASNSSGMYADISVADTVTKTFEFNEENISIVDVADGLSANPLPIKLTVTVTDRPEVVATIVKEDISFAASAKDLKEGTHKVSLQCNCTKNPSKVECNIKEIQIEVTQKAEQSTQDPGQDEGAGQGQ